MIAVATDTATAIVGRTGSGKTVTAKLLVEGMLDRRERVCIVDPTGVWFGLRRRADGSDGYPVVIFGGEHADVPVSAGAGARLGEIIAGATVHSAIVDVSEFTGGEATRFLTAFFETLYARASRQPLHLVLDEADMMAPQNPMPDQRRLQGAVNKIVRRGRVKGFRPLMITQRPAVIDKSVLSQISTMIAMRLTSPQDRKAIEDWIKGNADTGQARDVLESLPKLAVGEGWVWAPEDDQLERVSFPMISTYDSSRAPEHGEELMAPAALSSIDMGELATALASDDDAPAPAVAGLDPQALKRAGERGWRDGHAAGFRDGRSAMRRLAVAAIEAALAAARDEIGADEPDGPPDPSPDRSLRARQAPIATIGTECLNSAARKMLAVLDTNPPVLRTWQQVASLAGLKARGGHFNAGRRALLDAGSVVEDGGHVRIAEPSADAPEALDDPAALVDLWASVLAGAAPRILRDLFRHGPSPRHEVARRLGLAPRGGHWNAAWKELRINGIVEVTSDERAALTDLFRPGNGR